MPYKLSATLQGHSQDVRGVASPTNDLVLSASRDSRAIHWTRIKEEEGKEAAAFTIENEWKPSEGYINCITYAPATSEAPQGYVVTGGQDAMINVFIIGVASPEPAYTLLGHTANVCALAASPTGIIVSGSWDTTARVWRNFSEEYILKGHTHSVWAVLPLDDDQTLTGSADKTIKLWSQHKEIRRFHGHNDAVRSLSFVPDLGGFASCSNDSEIRVWTFGGDLVYTLVGHTSFVYSLAVLPNGDLVSSGEDRTVRVWKDGECSQTIVHPAISVWAVSTMPNGDIVSGCSDGNVRVFSDQNERWASEDVLTRYDEVIANQTLSSQQIGSVDKSNLPGVEALSQPGKKDGQVIMVKNGHLVEAHQWDNASNSWQKVGEVVDAVGSGRKQLHDGKEYDYVFDVDIKDGAPPLKLPYNANENPYQAAHRFLTRNELELTYLDEVASFITKNTSAVQLGNSNQYSDPFTGASRYIPRGQTTSGVTFQAPATSGNVDPFTGSGRNNAAKVIPVLKPLLFKQANISAMEKKIQEFTKSPEDEQAFSEIFQALGAGALTSITATHIVFLVQVIGRWDTTQIFPVTDLLRFLFASSPSILKAIEFDKPDLLRTLLQASEWQLDWTSGLSKTRETNVTLTLRTIANMLQKESGSVPAPWTKELFTQLGTVPPTVWSKPHLVSLATILLNYSCLVYDGSSTQDQAEHLALVEMVLNNANTDAEALYRALVAFGNVVNSKSKPKLGKATATWLRLTSSLSKKTQEKRIQDLVKEVQSLIV